MRRKIITLAAAGALTFGIAGPAFAVTVADPTPSGNFSQGSDKGYVQVNEGGAVLRACNENPNTPAGDSATGYIWVRAAGSEGTTPSYGNGNVGAGDRDGEGTGTTNQNDCP